MELAFLDIAALLDGFEVGDYLLQRTYPEQALLLHYYNFKLVSFVLRIGF